MAHHAESSDPSAPKDAAAPPDDTPAAPVASALDDPEYRRGVVELLGVLAFGEISACERLVADSQMAPDLRSKVEALNPTVDGGWEVSNYPDLTTLGN